MQPGRVDPKTFKQHLEFLPINLDDGFTSVPGMPGLSVRVITGTLDEEAKRGSITRLVKFAPDTKLDRIITRDCYQEVVILRGTLLAATPEDPSIFKSFPAPSFATRPPGVAHGPYAAGPDGCVLIESKYYMP